LQKTPLDKHAALVIHALCDTVIEKLMQRLGLGIPEFRLVRHLKITKTRDENSEKGPGEILQFQGIDSNNDPYTLFPKIEVKSGKNVAVLTKEPMVLVSKHFNNVLEVTLYFQGHYGEKPLQMFVDPQQLSAGSSKIYQMTFNPFDGEWEQLTNIS